MQWIVSVEDNWKNATLRGNAFCGFLWFPLAGLLSYKSFMLQVLRKIKLGLSLRVFVSLPSAPQGMDVCNCDSTLTTIWWWLMKVASRKRKPTHSHRWGPKGQKRKTIKLKKLLVFLEFKVLYFKLSTMLTLYTLKEAWPYQWVKTPPFGSCPQQ